MKKKSRENKNKKTPIEQQESIVRVNAMMRMRFLNSGKSSETRSQGEINEDNNENNRYH